MPRCGLLLLLMTLALGCAVSHPPPTPLCQLAPCWVDGVPFNPDGTPWAAPIGSMIDAPEASTPSPPRTAGTSPYPVGARPDCIAEPAYPLRQQSAAQTRRDTCAWSTWASTQTPRDHWLWELRSFKDDDDTWRKAMRAHDLYPFSLEVLELEMAHANERLLRAWRACMRAKGYSVE